MKGIVFALLFCLGKIQSLSVPTNSNPYCSKDTCPQYTVIQKYKNLELRCYKPSIWVSISGQGKLFVNDHNLPMWKLIQFINGNNTKGIQVPIGIMTSKLFDESRRVFSAEYYIPSYFWKSMPRELDRSVRVLYRQSFCAYVYGFTGWLHSFERLNYFRTNANLLIQKYGKMDDCYPDFFFYMTYHSGFLPDHNEIWYIVKFKNDDRRNNLSS